MKSLAPNSDGDEIEVFLEPSLVCGVQYGRVRVRESAGDSRTKASIYLTADQLEEHASDCMALAEQLRFGEPASMRRMGDEELVASAMCVQIGAMPLELAEKLASAEIPTMIEYDLNAKGIPNMIRPLHDRILVKRLDAESRTQGGIIIPDAAKEKPVEAMVIAVGAGKRNEAGERIVLDVKEGDRVLFAKYSGSEIKIEGVEHVILREEDILAVLS